MLYVIACVVMALLLGVDVVLGIYAHRNDNYPASMYRRHFINPTEKIDGAFLAVASITLVGGYLWGWELGMLVAAHVAALFIGGWWFSTKSYKNHREMIALKPYFEGRGIEHVETNGSGRITGYTVNGQRYTVSQNSSAPGWVIAYQTYQTLKNN